MRCGLFLTVCTPSGVSVESMMYVGMGLLLLLGRSLRRTRVSACDLVLPDRVPRRRARVAAMRAAAPRPSARHPRRGPGTAVARALCAARSVARGIKTAPPDADVASNAVPTEVFHALSLQLCKRHRDPRALLCDERRRARGKALPDQLDESDQPKGAQGAEGEYR